MFRNQNTKFYAPTRSGPNMRLLTLHRCRAKRKHSMFLWIGFSQTSKGFVTF
jgi:hypothetical protein